MEHKITKVQKRDGRIVDFDFARITNAIFKAITATGQGDEAKAKKIADDVLKIFNRRFKKDDIPSVEQIQDTIEEVLILDGLVDTAKAYILYREQRRASAKLPWPLTKRSIKLTNIWKNWIGKSKKTPTWLFLCRGLITMACPISLSGTG